MKHNKPREVKQMKKKSMAVIALILLVMFASDSGAWSVTIKNNTENRAEVVIYGNHLFWQQKDCEITIQSGETQTCTLPWAICPNYVQITERWGSNAKIHRSSDPKDILSALEAFYFSTKCSDTRIDDINTGLPHWPWK
jgi:hypothetical protein